MASDDLKLKALLESELSDAIGYLGGEVAEERTEAWKYYDGDPEIIPTRKGKSRVVSTDVANAVNWMLPQLLRVFFQNEHIAKFAPNQESDREKAEQATDYVNYVLMNDNPGFLVLHNWFFDALLQKNGVVKVYWEVTEDTRTSIETGQTADQLTVLLHAPDVEIIGQTSYEIPDMPGVTLYDVKVRRKIKNGRVCVVNVPPEEFLISKRAKSIADSPFCAHRVRKPRSDLVAMGYPEKTVLALPAYTDLDTNEESLARHNNDDQPVDDSRDPLMQVVQVDECYVRTDYDGDGIAELRKVVKVGNTILENEEWDEPPFADLTPRPMPHRWLGRSIADDVMPSQLLKTSILRQMMDNLYLSVNQRHVLAESGMTANTLDDYLNDEPGAPVRVKVPEAIQPLGSPWVASQAFPMLEYADKALEERTGQSRQARGLETDVLNNQTAKAAMLQESAAKAPLELIARVFAETGVKRLCQMALRQLVKYQDAPRIIRLRDKFVPMDPRDWDATMDVTVHVGLGTGDRDREVMALTQILAKQEQIFATLGPANPLVTIKQYYNTLARLIEAAGLKRPDPYFTDPGNTPLPVPPKPPDPKLVEIQQKGALAREQAAADIALKQMELRMKYGLETAQLESELHLRAQQMLLEAGIKSEANAMNAHVRMMQPIRVGGEPG